MKSSNKANINSKTYWNSIYSDDAKRAEYESLAHPGEYQHVGDRLINPSYRMQTAVDYVKGDKILDIGCGVGVFTKLVKDKYPNAEVWGVDISDKAIEADKKERSDIIYHHQYIGSLDKVPSNYFDTVFTGETLEHLEDPSLLIKDAQRALKKGGRLILTTPLRNAIPNDEHLWYFEKQDITKLFVDDGFTAPEFVDLPDLEYMIVIFAVGEKV